MDGWRPIVLFQSFQQLVRLLFYFSHVILQLAVDDVFARVQGGLAAQLHFQLLHFFFGSCLSRFPPFLPLEQLFQAQDSPFALAPVLACFWFLPKRLHVRLVRCHSIRRTCRFTCRTRKTAVVVTCVGRGTVHLREMRLQLPAQAQGASPGRHGARAAGGGGRRFDSMRSRTRGDRRGDEESAHDETHVTTRDARSWHGTRGDDARGRAMRPREATHVNARVHGRCAKTTWMRG
mmetsp:Transcript_10441/g.63848  ORF Transcript_10441/g.63848 Transcript_10441/m.63848 type:complete len:234 (-) Transcript_10441:1124-1825(-)